MMGTWTSVLYRPLVYKIVEDVFARIQNAVRHQDIYRDGINIKHKHSRCFPFASEKCVIFSIYYLPLPECHYLWTDSQYMKLNS